MMLWLNIGLGTKENPGGIGVVGTPGGESSSSEPDETRVAESSSRFTTGVDVAVATGVGVDVGITSRSSDRVVRDRGPTTGGLPARHGDSEFDCK